jgi:hypothetical protein
MKRLIAIFLALLFAIGSLTIPATPANAWLLPFLFRAAVVNTAKQEFRARRAKCINQPRACRQIVRSRVGRTNIRLRSTAKKFKYGRQRIRHKSTNLR